MVNHFSLVMVLKLQRNDINLLQFLLGKTSKKPLYSSFSLQSSALHCLLKGEESLSQVHQLHELF